jgi:hypothetical protein
MLGVTTPTESKPMLDVITLTDSTLTESRLTEDAFPARPPGSAAVSRRSPASPR